MPARDAIEATDAVEDLGVANGNGQVTLKIPMLNEETDYLVSATVVANGASLPPGAYDVDGISITIPPNQCDSNADIAVDYVYGRRVVTAVTNERLGPIDDEYMIFQSPAGKVNWVDTNRRLSW